MGTWSTTAPTTGSEKDMDSEDVADYACGLKLMELPLTNVEALAFGEKYCDDEEAWEKAVAADDCGAADKTVDFPTW